VLISFSPTACNPKVSYLNAVRLIFSTINVLRLSPDREGCPGRHKFGLSF
jgi:hypothetical protein